MADLSPDQAIQVLRGLPEDRQRAILGKLSPQIKQGIMQKLSAPKQSGPEERTVGNYASEIASGVGRGLENDVTGLAQTVMHPIDTVTGLVTQAGDAASAAAKEFRDTSGAPITQRLAAGTLAGLEKAPLIGGMVQHAERGGERMASPEAAGSAAEGITTFAAPELAGKAVGPLTKGLADTSRSLRSAITGTGPKVTAKLVEDAKSGNAVADAHIKTQAAIETARRNALKEGNAKYNTVNEKLNHIEADPEVMQSALGDAAGSIKGSNTEPPIFKDMLKRVDKGDTFSYEDLQGYYSELGKELSKGTLPGDIYHAYDQMHETIGNEMQRIADQNGAGEQLKDARGYWRRMKQTFGKPLGENDAATGVLRSQSPEMAHAQEMGNRIRLLGSFDPEIPKHFANLQKARAAAKDAPSVLPGETTKIGPEEVRNAKTEAIQNRVDNLRSPHSKFANTLVALDVIRNAVHGNVAGIGTDLAVRGIYGLGKRGLASALERPEVVKLLTNPTPADIAQIPAEMRGDFGNLINQAKSQGIKVDPRIGAVLGITALNGSKAKQLQEISDHFRSAE